MSALTAIERLRLHVELDFDAPDMGDLLDEIDRLRGFIADFAGNRFERIGRRAQDPQDDLDPVADWNAIDAWQDDARAVLEGKP